MQKNRMENIKTISNSFLEGKIVLDGRKDGRRFKYPLNKVKYLDEWKNRADTILDVYFYGDYSSMTINAVEGA
ncbi:hypothetical protein R9X47_22650 [Wukongibacter baidiensis]|uniref:hypothetical protein n=1 Tax=Wukongibacter baidiensis TaxID=1723361 RepID=UPI003D7F406C